MTYALAFQALADPTRRSIFERLRRGPMAVGQIARGLPVSRPAVSQHLRVLKEAALVSEHSEGTRNIYNIDPRGLEAVRAYIESYWDDVLGAFKQEAEKQAQKARGGSNGPRKRTRSPKNNHG